MLYEHELPSDAQVSGVTHARMLDVNQPSGQIHPTFVFGEYDADGNWDRHGLSDPNGQQVPITDGEAFDTESFTEDTAPETKGDSRSRFHRGICLYLDAHDLWPTQQ